MSNPGVLIPRLITPADDQGLITLDDAKLRLGIDPADTSQDDKLTGMIANVSARMSNYCDRLFPQQVYRDQYRGVCLDLMKPLRCRQYPIALDTSGNPLLTITVEGTAIDPATYDVNPDTGALYLIDGVWVGLIVLDYTAGYEPIPPDLQSVAGDWVQARYFSADRDPSIQSETVFDASMVVYANAAQAASTTGDAALPPVWVCDGLIYYRYWSV
jgi:hypothetical protein